MTKFLSRVLREPNWHYFHREEQAILEEMKHPANQGRLQQWLLRIALRAARAGKRDATDLRGRWRF